ncbi:uncharacterized protein LOC112345089 [Selaginella moellendorffii]|uniref:uncharacterized protein LOC112345089 n=1 Tax=Selaginella moellendorffii TaxID=88036 RepID=UPI000D1CA07A|nr:uncharacterized protein LOC112345089 [Selaginella moellendorffii]|eukprot:XP_024526881.1 uncharacterized protein LOC112345089 [Selaginella moellendorffii]
MAVAEARKLDPEELWKWMDDFHWQNFHGIWVNWRIDGSSACDPAKVYRSIRSFQSHADDRSVVLHKNDWYDPRGGNRDWMLGPWLINRQDHCGADGIIHPAVPSSRTLIFPNGDLGWLPLEIDFPRKPVPSEVHFMLPGKEGRAAIIFSYSTDGSVSASQILEESRDSGERPGDSWHGSVWKHELATVPLEPSREEPRGEFVGQEMTLFPCDLTLETRGGVAWGGFKSACDEEHASVVHMPYGFTACVPRKVNPGQEFACLVNWVVSADEVRRISWKYSAEGKLDHIKSASFHPVKT